MKRFSDLFFSWIFPWVPKRLLSRFVGILMRVPLPEPIAAFVVPSFATLFGIKMSEAQFEPEKYHSLDDFFTRHLKSGLRPIQGALVHPADAVLTQTGWVTKGELIQAKGWTYPLAEFLGDQNLAEGYEGGSFASYYLCPADYHRVHAPCDGELVSAKHIPGLLWPVNDWSVHNIRRLFCLNERVVLNFKGANGPWSLVMVGATNVGHITITADPSIVTNKWMWHLPTDRHYSPPIKVQVGDDIGAFHLGSTVICIYSRAIPALKTPRPTKVGESLQ